MSETTPTTMVVMRLDNGSLCCTGMCSVGAGPSLFSSFDMNYLYAQIAMGGPQAQALKPGESFTLNKEGLK